MGAAGLKCFSAPLCLRNRLSHTCRLYQTEMCQIELTQFAVHGVSVSYVGKFMIYHVMEAIIVPSLTHAWFSSSLGKSLAIL